MSVPAHGGLDEYFDAIHQHEDPFGYRSRWYEARKRAILLATLPSQRYLHGWEIGCSNGELTVALATRCDHLLATDLSANAVSHACMRTEGLAHVDVVQACHPAQWPDGKYDLIVLSEVGYYLTENELSNLIERLGNSLVADGLLVACHWLHGFEQAYQDGRHVHAQLRALLTMSTAYRYEDADFLLEGWTAVTTSVAQREGLR